MSPLALGLDLGSSGLRLALVEATPQGGAQLLSEQSASYPRPFAHPIGWIEGLVELVSRLEPEQRARVGAIAIAGTSGTLLRCRTDGTPLPGEAGLALAYHLSCPEQAAEALRLCGDPASPAASASGSLARALRLIAAGLPGPATASAPEVPDDAGLRCRRSDPFRGAEPARSARAAAAAPGTGRPGGTDADAIADPDRQALVPQSRGPASAAPQAARGEAVPAAINQPEPRGAEWLPAGGGPGGQDQLQGRGEVMGHATAGDWPTASAGGADRRAPAIEAEGGDGAVPFSPPGTAAPGASDACLLRHQADWLMGWLLGDWRWGEEGNNLRLGWELQSQAWSGAIASQPWAAELPRIRPSGAVLGTLAAAVAARLGLPSDCRVVAGSTDANAGVLAADPQEGDGITVLGTTLVLKQFVQAPISAPGVSCHRVDGRWLLGGASNAGAGILRRFFRDEQIAELSRQIDPRRPSGLDLLPLPGRGERFPVDDPELEPRLEPRPVSDALYLQGLLEGLTALEAAGWRRLQDLGAPPLRRVITLGGGARNPQWRLLRQRALGVPVLQRPGLSAALGMARLALRAVGRMGAACEADP